MEGQKKSGSDLQQCINWLHIELPKRFKEAPKSNEIRWLFSIELHDERRLRCALCARACLPAGVRARACVRGWVAGWTAAWVGGRWMGVACAERLSLAFGARARGLAGLLASRVCLLLHKIATRCVCVFC